MFLHRLAKTRAPEFPKELTWFNSSERSLQERSGKVVLLDFWTYSCVNCIRTLPHLKRWHETYKDAGLTIIGIHTPEFAFEKEQDNVEMAVKDLDISYPVVLDNDYKIWNLYSNRWWPRKFLIDAQGSIVYDHIGEGGYAETEHAIQRALTQIGASGLPPIKPDDSVGGGICYRTTPELYLGFLRGRFGNSELVQPNVESSFSALDNYVDDIVYLQGHWTVLNESVQHTRKLAHASEYLLLKYSAFSVNLVMGTTSKGVRKVAEIEIELDGQPLPEDMAGDDVVYKKKRAFVQVKKTRLYHVIDSDIYHRGTLKIKTSADNLEMFAFTFGGCAGM